MRPRSTLIVVIFAAHAAGLVTMSVKGKSAAGQGFGASRGAGRGRGGNKPGRPPKPAPTLEEAVAGFPDRLPADTDAPCACGAGPGYASCCRPYHLAERLPDSATRVLQSRFTAFAYRQPAHLIRTTHATNRDWRADRAAWARALNREGLFDDFDFVRLEAGVEEAGATDGEAYVTFRAVLKPRAGGEEVAFRERSRFLRDDGDGWLYASGEVQAEGSGLDGAVLNG